MNILTKIRLINELNLKELKQGVSSDLILTFEMTSRPGRSGSVNPDETH